MKQFPGDRWFAELAEPISKYMVLKSTENDVLQHATLSMAALLASTDPDGQPQPKDACIRQYLEHKQTALQLLRCRLKNLDIDPHVAAAVALLIMGEMGSPSTRVHMHGLKSVLEHLQNPNRYESAITVPLDKQTLSPLVWLSWAVGIRFDIGQATIEGNPVLDPLPFTPESESAQRSWISEVCSPFASETVEWGICIFTLRGLLHRAIHIAGTARKIRESPDYCVQQEFQIQSLCIELEKDLDAWLSRPLVQQVSFEEQQQPRASGSSAKSFLHYAPLEIHNSAFHNLMNDYRTARLYNSFVANPEIGPGLFRSERVKYAVEMCRTMVAARIGHYWRRLSEGSRLFQLFLCCLAFGGEDYYPLESRAALDMFVELVPKHWGISAEEMINRWIKSCPGLPSVSAMAFPSLNLESYGEAQLASGMFCKKSPWRRTKQASE
jgi:Fungal specific transcription factor domain